MRRILRATTSYKQNIRVVFVDPLQRAMADLRALRSKVADAETQVALEVMDQRLAAERLLAPSAADLRSHGERSMGSFT